MKKLKITQPGYENFTGQFGRYDFVDSVSVELLSRAERDRLACSIQCVEIDEMGQEVDAGPSARILQTAHVIAEIEPTMAVMTEEEHRALKLAEIDKVEAKKAAGVPLNAREELMKVADKEGIEGLRKIGIKWGVRSKSITGLIDAILAAQEAATSKIETLAARARAEIETGVPAAIAANTAEAFVPEVTSAVEPAAEPVAEPAAPVDLLQEADKIIAEATAPAAPVTPTE